MKSVRHRAAHVAGGEVYGKGIGTGLMHVLHGLVEAIGIGEGRALALDGSRGLLADGGGLHAGQGDDGALAGLGAGLVDQDQLILIPAVGQAALDALQDGAGARLLHPGHVVHALELLGQGRAVLALRVQGGVGVSRERGLELLGREAALAHQLLPQGGARPLDGRKEGGGGDADHLAAGQGGPIRLGGQDTGLHCGVPRRVPEEVRAVLVAQGPEHKRQVHGRRDGGIRAELGGGDALGQALLLGVADNAVGPSGHVGIGVVLRRPLLIAGAQRPHQHGDALRPVGLAVQVIVDGPVGVRPGPPEQAELIELLGQRQVAPGGGGVGFAVLPGRVNRLVALRFHNDLQCAVGEPGDFQNIGLGLRCRDRFGGAAGQVEELCVPRVGGAVGDVDQGQLAGVRVERLDAPGPQRAAELFFQQRCQRRLALELANIDRVIGLVRVGDAPGLCRDDLHGVGGKLQRDLAAVPADHDEGLLLVPQGLGTQGVVCIDPVCDRVRILIRQGNGGRLGPRRVGSVAVAELGPAAGLLPGGRNADAERQRQGQRRGQGQNFSFHGESSFVLHFHSVFDLGNPSALSIADFMNDFNHFLNHTYL